jgi:hypothetical protein
MARATSFSAVRISAASFSANAAVRRDNCVHPFRHAGLDYLAVAFGSASIAPQSQAAREEKWILNQVQDDEDSILRLRGFA